MARASAWPCLCPWEARPHPIPRYDYADLSFFPLLGIAFLAPPSPYCLPDMVTLWQSLATNIHPASLGHLGSGNVQKCRRLFSITELQGSNRTRIHHSVFSTTTADLLSVSVFRFFDEVPNQRVQSLADLRETSPASPSNQPQLWLVPSSASTTGVCRETLPEAASSACFMTIGLRTREYQK